MILDTLLFIIRSWYAYVRMYMHVSMYVCVANSLLQEERICTHVQGVCRENLHVNSPKLSTHTYNMVRTIDNYLCTYTRQMLTAWWGEPEKLRSLTESL